MQLKLAELESLLKTLEGGGVGEFEYEDETIRLRIAIPRGVAPAPMHVAPLRASSPQASPAPLAAPGPAAADANLVAVTSPFVGTFYRASSPESANFVEVGSVVKKGQTLCIVEAMKLMNEIEAETAGTIVEVLVANGKSVEYGQKLFLIRPS
ncbi:MAG TPA: acetyl-CoA carboxylase biotin carboxyl carrier protein [Polyangiaceae bacterium]